MDLILGGWAAAHLAHASEAELDLFEAILAEADLDLYQWVSGQQPAPEAYAAFIEDLAATVRIGGA
ncbi:succinate dehydrogenase assembly factor 2 [Rhodophyticola sp. CCM32]|nr:succinate dehydrogenase assembly factor 2 [Rhodophyticola sp. CCM32]